jgi:DNA-directed RNA polymerase specialized sigma24 family protein
MASMNEWGMTRNALDGLLGWLDADQAAAAKKYEQTRHALIKFFETRGCHTAEEQADQTIDRVARRVAEGVELTVNEPVAYFYGVARHVLQEYHRRPHSSSEAALHVPDDAEARHRRYDCMGRCLDELPLESRALLVAYCSVNKRDKEQVRRSLADKLGVSLNTLRIRVHRLREHLGRCVRGCMEENDRQPR